MFIVYYKYEICFAVIAAVKIFQEILMILFCDILDDTSDKNCPVGVELLGRLWLQFMILKFIDCLTIK